MMSFLHNIKKTCASTTNLIKNILNIKDKHITFPDYAYAFSNEKIHGVLSKVFSGLLSYPENPHCCSFCGKSGTVIKHTPKASLIQMIPYQNVPTYLRLYKQRYRCKACGQTFSATTNIVDERCYLSNALKFAILHDLKQKCAMTDIAKRYFVSPKSVERILKSYSYELNPYPMQLPECLLIDEFKGPSDCNGKMCFILSDGQSGKIIDILDDRRNFVIKDFFLRFSLESRNRVKYVVMDMNASYPYAIKEIFPNAEIIIDRFHIVQQLNRALNNKRIQVMKEQKNKESRHYTKLKRYWKFVLTHEDNLNYEKRLQYPLFDKKFVTQTEVVDTLLSFDEGFKQCYEIYQTLLGHFKDKEYNNFFDILYNLPQNLDKTFKKSIKYLTKQTRNVKNALKLPYSNGKLEGKNNLIKVFQRIAFGFRNFGNMRRRIFLYEEKWQTKKPKKRKCRRKAA